jgi:hypothetical protein
MDGEASRTCTIQARTAEFDLRRGSSRPVTADEDCWSRPVGARRAGITTPNSERAIDLYYCAAYRLDS